MKFGVWVVDLILQYTVDILNAAGHGRGGVVWLALALGLGLVGLIWPLCGVLCRVLVICGFFSHLRGLLGGFWWFGGQGCPRRDAHDSGRRRRFRSHLVLSPPPRMRGWARPPVTAALFAPLASPTGIWSPGSPRIQARRG